MSQLAIASNRSERGNFVTYEIASSQKLLAMTEGVSSYGEVKSNQ
jgi:hypothetical protein